MKNLLQFFLASIVLLFQTMFANAQATTPDWARHIYSTNGNGVIGVDNISTDSYGNIYMLTYSKGKAYAGGQSTADSTTSSLITSWDCNGNLRWIKSIGFTNTGGVNTVIHLQTDTLGSFYIFGTISATLPSTSAYWGTDTAINLPINKNIYYLIKYDSLGQYQWYRTHNVRG